MPRPLLAYLTTAACFFALDFVWLGFVALKLYKDAIGDLLLEKPNMVAAGLFYLIYVIGVVYFAVLPALDEKAWTRAALNGALFGFFAYLTYDMTNLATLKGYPLHIALIDTAWGTVLSCVAATVGFLATTALSKPA